MSPKRFLEDLGLSKKPKLKAGSPEYFEQIRVAGFHADDVHDNGGFGPKAGDAFFCTDEVARATLSNDFGRYQDELQQLGELRGVPPKPRRVAEIGAGAGIIALYIAEVNPDAEVTAYDQCGKPLLFAEKLAKSRARRNISFHRGSLPRIIRFPVRW